MKSADQISDYSHAWAEYNRRWRAAWAVPLLLFGCYLATAFVNDGKPWTWILVLAVLTYVVLYIRFIGWPCPRCKRQFTMSTQRGVFRARSCIHCGLPRSEETSGS